jgi:hypothetical protein
MRDAAAFGIGREIDVRGRQLRCQQAFVKRRVPKAGRLLARNGRSAMSAIRPLSRVKRTYIPAGANRHDDP